MPFFHAVHSLGLLRRWPSGGKELKNTSLWVCTGLGSPPHQAGRVLVWSFLSPWILCFPGSLIKTIGFQKTDCFILSLPLSQFYRVTSSKFFFLNCRPQLTFLFSRGNLTGSHYLLFLYYPPKKATNSTKAKTRLFSSLTPSLPIIPSHSRFTSLNCGDPVWGSQPDLVYLVAVLQRGNVESSSQAGEAAGSEDQGPWTVHRGQCLCVFGLVN